MLGIIPLTGKPTVIGGEVEVNFQSSERRQKSTSSTSVVVELVMGPTPLAITSSLKPVTSIGPGGICAQIGEVAQSMLIKKIVFFMMLSWVNDAARYKKIVATSIFSFKKNIFFLK